jgi:hypothetical protein
VANKPNDILTGYLGSLATGKNLEIDYLTYGNKQVDHQFSKILVMDTQWEEFIELKNIQYQHNYPDLFIDIWILTKLADPAALQRLKDIK